jgi:NNP family nitrate/nitrite transporter-like MFS transporter
MPEPVKGHDAHSGVRNIFPFPLSTILFLVFIFTLNFASRVVLSPLLPLLEREQGLGHGEAGSLFLLIQFGYCFGLLVTGVISSRINHRRTILLSTTALGIVLLAMSGSTSMAGIRVGLVLLGTSAGLYLPSGMSTITEEIPRKHWGKAIAVHELAPNLGFVAAPLMAEVVLRMLPWRGVLAVLGALAILAGALFQMFTRGGTHRSEPPNFGMMRQLMRDSSLWVTAMCFAVAVGLSMGLYAMMPLFLVSEIGMERGLANTIVGLSRASGIGMIFFAGLVTDRVGHRRALTIFFSAMGILTLLLGLIHGRVITAVLVFLQPAAVACFFPTGFSMVSQIFPANLRGLAVSVVTIFGSLVGAGAIPPGIGYLAEITSFSLALSLLGLFTLSMPLLLRYGTASASTPGGRPPDSGDSR